MEASGAAPLDRAIACLDHVPEDVVQHELLPFLCLTELRELCLTSRWLHFLMSLRSGGYWPVFYSQALKELQRMNQMNLHEDDEQLSVHDDSSAEGPQGVVNAGSPGAASAAALIAEATVGEDEVITRGDSSDDESEGSGGGHVDDDPRDDPRDSFSFRSIGPREQVQRVLDFTKGCVNNLWGLFTDGGIDDDLETLCEFNFSGRKMNGWWGSYKDDDWFSRGASTLKTLFLKNPRRANLLMNVATLHLADWDLKKNGNPGPREIHRSAFYGIEYDTTDCRQLNMTFDELVFQQDDCGEDLESAVAAGSDTHIRRIVGPPDASAVALFGASLTSKLEVLGRVREKLEDLLSYCDREDLSSISEAVGDSGSEHLS